MERLKKHILKLENDSLKLENDSLKLKISEFIKIELCNLEIGG
ncbi:hypothetical protein [Clostridium butyricum]|nr:hypothetical protein [Clostridium butyricum]